MNIYSCVVSHDTGFAPNPFWGFCTLACCKPVIRRTASVGDWIIGLTPKRLGNNIVFAMKITEKISFAEYWLDKRYRVKRANLKRKDPVYHCGDNIYKPISRTEYLQKHSRHSNIDGSENIKSKKHDLNGKFVLISTRFSYFGSKPKKMTDEFKDLIVARSHKRFEWDETSAENKQQMLLKLVRFLENLPKGVHGKPRNWPAITDKKYNMCKSCES